ncbi:hypothetical protein D6C81_06928 [Aureobasidium pullulans]|uniref:Uncharacterized protein n=1 Tax=Aureobasidium pullulans TaxID=5580 RepID=A0A4S8SA99_AURPU|nr:hypothetical protein D6D28_07582 [Aureobasidium pullulans]TIA14010.1 hypothetical protein D6C81_06928 [Aureobasidium pullulans]
MLSIPSSDSFNKAHDGRQLRSTVSEQSIELSIWNEDDKKALVSPKSNKSWKPLTQKAFFLVPTILASGALIAVLQVYLTRSEQDAGILFASKISALPLNQTFSYLYLPTIISLVLSFVWTWIDLDIKRLQPYVQLSRDGGALGNDSILMHYPFDFVASVPFTAVRRRHWPVFSASLAVVIIFWGLTPLQSSIFATKMIEKTLQVTTVTSSSYLSLRDQKTTLTGSYAQSVYNIAWLNESLPPFMSRQGIIAPFSLLDDNTRTETSETWTARTHFYSVDINCESPTYDEYDIISTSGCRYYIANTNLPSKTKDDQYNSLYVGYWYEESMDSYLRGSCPDQANQTFLLRWSRGRKNLTDSTNSPYPLEGTTLWCKPTYYQQEVNATIAPPSMSVLNIAAIGPKEPLPADLVNITDFEWSLSQGYEVNNNRGQYPTSTWPTPYDQLHSHFPELYWDIYLPTLASFALGAYQRPVADYLDPEVLKDSYQAAYRLLLARKLADILLSDFEDGKQSPGTRHYSTQALIMVPTFVYVVEGLLAMTIVAALTVISIPSWRKTNLVSEPASLAAMMALSGNDSRLVQTMSGKDCATSTELENSYRHTTFALRNCHQGPTLCCIDPDLKTTSVVRAKSARPILPVELSWYFGSGFLGLQLLVIVALVFTYIRTHRDNGLPLPSTSIFINQILVKYLPMVVGAFFEPIFTWLTRTLCMLQPYEKLRKGNTPPSRALTVDYDSLPPQAILFRALKAGSISLASVCCIMTLLANVLSVAFSNVLHERQTTILTPQNFTADHRLPLSGSNIPNSTYDHYYIAMSNLTAGTPLPAWTDEKFFYVPFGGLESRNTSTALYQARTPAVSASLQCYSLRQTRHGERLTWDIPADSPTCNSSSLFTHGSFQSRVPEALEYTSLWPSRFGDDISDCELTVQAGWGRSSLVSTADPVNASWLGCKPELRIELREVTVDSRGLVQYSEPTDDILDSREQLFEPNAKSIIDAFHILLGSSNTPEYPFHSAAGGAHNDSYPSDFLNYLMAQALNSSAILDPHLPPPTFDTTAPVLEALYTRLFAIVLGTHVSAVLEKNNETALVTGFVVAPETRVFVSEPMFLVSVAILGIYILFTIVLYVCRPWKMLPRMPTTIASQIAFFAASHAMHDLADTSSMSEKERNSQMIGPRQRYGYGRFVGTDGKVHIGIEREPLVQALNKQDLRTMQKDVISD